MPNSVVPFENSCGLEIHLSYLNNLILPHHLPNEKDVKEA
jgi:hypothetical protein